MCTHSVKYRVEFQNQNWRGAIDQTMKNTKNSWFDWNFDSILPIERSNRLFQMEKIPKTQWNNVKSACTNREQFCLIVVLSNSFGNFFSISFKKIFVFLFEKRTNFLRLLGLPNCDLSLACCINAIVIVKIRLHVGISIEQRRRCQIKAWKSHDFRQLLDDFINCLHNANKQYRNYFAKWTFVWYFFSISVFSMGYTRKKNDRWNKWEFLRKMNKERINLS